MRLAIVKSTTRTRSYRVVELIESKSHIFGIVLDADGRAGWKTYSNKAEAFRSARRIRKALAPIGSPHDALDGRVYIETPFHPVTSALRLEGPPIHYPGAIIPIPSGKPTYEES